MAHFAHRSRRVTAGNRALACVGAAVALASAAASSPAGAAVVGASSRSAAVSGGTADWPQFGGNASHTGSSTVETAISASTVPRLTHRFTATLPGVVDASPVYRHAVSTASGIRDLLFLTTRTGSTVAVDGSTGAIVWTRTVGPGSCYINNGSTPCYTTAAPAVEPSGLYVYAYGLDGRVHKYAAGTGAEATTGGWPERATLKPFDEKGSADLAIATSRGVPYLYVANGGYPGDRGDYQGHLTTINLATGAQTVFNTLCSSQTVHFASRTTPDCAQVQSAMWARGGAFYDSTTDRILIATGNGDYSPSRSDWADSVLALHPDGSGVGGGPLDSYTPSSYQALQDADADLGSTGPAKVAAPVGSIVTDLGVQSGKDATLRLLNLANLSGAGGAGHTGGSLQAIAVPQGGEVLTQPVSWTNPADGGSWVFVANDNGMSALRITVAAGHPQMTPAWTSALAGTTPIVAGNVLFVLTNSGAKALDPTTGDILWYDLSGAVGLHWQSPIVVNGFLYYPDGSGRLRAFALPASVPNTGPIIGIARKCLDDYHSGPANGNRIQLYTCNGGAAQHWTAGSDGTLRVLGKCLDDYHSGTANGNRIQLYACNGTAAQHWTAASDGSLRVLGKCLDVYHSGTADGNTVQLYQCNATAAQQWRLP